MEKQKIKPQIKRYRALNTLAISLVVEYIFLLVFGFIFDYYFHQIWFSLAVVLIGFYLIVRAIFFNLDSDLLWGLLCLFFGCASGVFFFVESNLIFEIYMLLFALSNMLVYFVFRQNFYIILFALVICEVLLLGVFGHGDNPLIFWAIQSVYFVAVGLSFVFMMWRKENKSAVSNKQKRI